MFIANDQKVGERRSKLDAIGTLLEKAVIANPYKAPNSQQCVPSVFVNTKLYGKATQDDPANNLNLLKQIRGKKSKPLIS